jgi:pyruvyl transferase EpsO
MPVTIRRAQRVRDGNSTNDRSMSMAAEPDDFSQLSIVAQEASALLAELVPYGAVCALLDHPDYPNVGDSAIWLGQRELLRRRNARIAYSCSIKTFDESALRRAMPHGIVLIQGGGNFGTLWPHHQVFRENVLTRLRDYKVVQLPQSIRYEDDAALMRTAALIAQHPDFTLCVRDEASLRIATRQLNARALLCPDSALLLEGKLTRRTPDVDCLVLARTDKERAFDGLERVFADSGITVVAADWLEEPYTRLHGLRDRFVRASKRAWSSNALFQYAMLQLWDRLAWQRTNRGCELLSRGRIVVTDRLHAHILSTLLGIPNIVLDNSYGKLSGFIAAWTARNPLCHQAASVEQARQIAQRLLRA